MDISARDGGFAVRGFGKINLERTLFCGQAFRWERTEDGFSGVSRGRFVTVSAPSETELFFDCSADDLSEVWLPYFDMDRDYTGAVERISRDGAVRASVEENGVIHILNQEPWETLCSFIISACNNIPRIRKIVRSLCVNFGEDLGRGFSFPSAPAVASLSADDLAVIAAGYRVPFILDAARAVAEGRIDFDALRRMDFDAAEKTLMTVKGVGKKVADCALLYSLGFFDSYPVDRHIARATAELYPDGLPKCFDGARGLAQQYLFLRMQ